MRKKRKGGKWSLEEKRGRQRLGVLRGSLI
jgi:hypothetical protein